MKFKFLFLICSLLMSMTSFAENGDIFTSQTEEGVEMTFKVLNEEDHSCQVGAGTTESAIANDYTGRLTIPSSAEGYTVVSISNFAFLDCNGISELVLPESITILANYAFLGVGSESSPCLITVPDGYDFGVDISGSFFRWKGGIFHVIHKPYAWLSAEGKTLTFLCDGKESSREGSVFKLNEDNDRPEWYSMLSSITEVVFDPSFAEVLPLTTKSWFEDMSQLQSITGLSYLNTSKVRKMNSMFKGCYNLRELDLSNFDTSSTTLMSNMFSNCSSLTMLDLSGFNFSKVTSLTRMFSDCENLSELTFGNTLTTDSLEKANYMFSNCKNLHVLDLSDMVINEGTSTIEMLSGCSSLDTLSISPSMSNLNSDACIGVGSSEKPCLLYAPEGLEVAYLDEDMFLWKSGIFHYPKSKAYVVETDSTLTFLYDNGYDSLLSDSTLTVHMLNEDLSERTWSFQCNESDSTKTYKVVFTPSFSQFHPNTTSSWFALDVDTKTCKSGIKLEFEGMENLNTSEVTDMSRMFYGCMGATGLDFSYFDTSNVTDMSYMFAYCTTETHFILSNFDTSNVTDLSGMFYCCIGLKALDLSNFNTSEVVDMSEMFYGCTNLSGVDLTGFNTSKVTNMSNLFAHCHSLQSLNIIHFVTSEVMNMSNMFAYCENLSEIDVTAFDTHNVTNMDAMFLKCKKLSEINITNFDLSSVTTMNGMFAKCQSITSLELSMLDFSTVTTYDCPDVDQNMHWEDTEEDCYLGFLSNCSSLTSISIPITMNGLTDVSCIGVGTESAPCLIYAPDEFDFLVDTNGHSFFWKGGYFTIDHTPDPNAVTMSVETDLLMSGDRSNMNINLFNGDEVFNGFQFEIHLPDGISLAKKGDNYAYELSDRFSEKGMNVTIRDYGNGNYRLIAFSLSNITIQGNEGCIITLKLKADRELLSGEYLGSLSNIVLSHIDGYSTDVGTVEFVIPVSSYALGDVNHDGYVNVTDIMLVVNRILDNHSLNYHEENADMNHDGRIDVTDVMQIVNLILINDGAWSIHQAYSDPNGSITMTATQDGYDLLLDSSESYTACQMKVQMENGATLSGATVNGISNNHRVHIHSLGNGLYNIVAYSPENHPIGTTMAPLHLNVAGNKNGILSISDIILTNNQFDTFVMPDIHGVATCIVDASASQQAGNAYTLQGTKAPANAKGIIIRDGRKTVSR